MKNTKKTILAIGAVALLLGILLMPCINATMLEEDTVETTAENGTVEGDVLTGGAENEDYESACFGSIYGTTFYLFGWGIYGLPFALVEARIGDVVVGKDRSSFLYCFYRIRRLPIDHTYTVTASSEGYIEHNGKYFGFIPETTTVTLTADNPNVRIDFYLDTEPTDPPDNANVQMKSNTYSFRILERILSINQHFNRQQNNNI